MSTRAPRFGCPLPLPPYMIRPQVGDGLAVGVGVGVGVKVAVAVAVGVGVNVAVAVAVGDGDAVGVGVGETQESLKKLSCKPSISPPVPHSNCVKCEPVSRCAPTVALSPVLPFRVPYMISKLGVFSCKRTSKSRAGVPSEQQRFSRNSMLKMRLGAVPDTDVNTPCPFSASISYRSSQYGAIRSVRTKLGRQSFMNAASAPANCRLPFDEILTEKKVWS